MKNLCIILFCLPVLVFSQSQTVNGIDINGPEGFIKNNDLEWTQGEDIIFIQYFKGNSVPFQDYEKMCRDGTRGTSFLKYDLLELSGNEHPLCLQEGVNGHVVLQSMIHRDGYLYSITVGVDPNQYDVDRYEKTLDKIYSHMGYMLERIRVF